MRKFLIEYFIRKDKNNGASYGRYVAFVNFFFYDGHIPPSSNKNYGDKL